MFTGLIEDLGSVLRIQGSPTGGRLVIQTGLPVGEITLGDSVAVDGACLTVVAVGPSSLEFDYSRETGARTTLARMRPGDKVHLERAMRLTARLDGHLVSGHVDGVGAVAQRIQHPDSLYLRISAPPAVHRYLVQKGCVAVGGVSLTVNEVGEDSFAVTLVPFTLSKTWLGDLSVGDPVNLEADLLARYVERLMAPGHRAGGGLTLATLTASGFVAPGHGHR